MSSYSAFRPEYLQSLIEPFIPGISARVTPIKYEALSPDTFMLLFRYIDTDDISHFFVCLETDSQNSLD